MKNIDDLRRSIHKMNQQFRHSGIDLLELTELLDIVKNPCASLPCNKNPGVYIFLDEAMNILYIDKASCGNVIGGRLKRHFNEKWHPTDDKSSGCRFITAIPLPPGHYSEASKIEEFLIAELNPPRNDKGKRQ
ncbi:MAG: hypothetical protein OEW69_09140 [Nitrospirota bacterium]|nr:hypothetical protein [Nitrospirota bacterium]